jgi:HK97 family phage major capsid protein
MEVDVNNIVSDQSYTFTGEQIRTLRDGWIDEAVTRAYDRMQAQIQAAATPEELAGVFEQEDQRQFRTIGRPGAVFRTRSQYEAAAKEAKVIGRFIRAVMERDHGTIALLAKENPAWYPETVRANFNETTTGQGVELVPAVWSDQIINVAEVYGYARAIANVYPMSAKTEYLNQGGSTIAMMVGEQTAPTPIDATNFFKQTALLAKVGAAAFLTTLELMKDAKPAFIQYMTRELGRAMAQLIDVQYFNGDGTGNNHTGLINTSGTAVVYLGNASNSTKTSFDKISWKDLFRLMLSVPMSLGTGAIFVVPQTVFGYLVLETDTSGRPIWNMQSPPSIGNVQGISPLGSSTFWTPFGKPIVVVPDSCFPSSAAGKVCAIYGDHGQFGYLGELEGQGLETYRENYNGVALSGVRRMAIEVSQRFGIAFPAPSAFGLLKTSLT